MLKPIMQIGQENLTGVNFQDKTARGRKNKLWYMCLSRISGPRPTDAW